MSKLIGFVLQLCNCQRIFWGRARNVQLEATAWLLLPGVSSSVLPPNLQRIKCNVNLHALGIDADTPCSNLCSPHLLAHKIELISAASKFLSFEC